MQTLITILYGLLKAFGLIEALMEKHHKQKQAQDIANAPISDEEESSYWHNHRG